MILVDDYGVGDTFLSLFFFLLDVYDGDVLDYGDDGEVERKVRSSLRWSNLSAW